MEKPYQKQRPNSINIIQTLFRRMEWFRSDLPNFDVVVRDIVLNDLIVKVREIAEIVF